MEKKFTRYGAWVVLLVAVVLAILAAAVWRIHLPAPSSTGQAKADDVTMTDLSDGSRALADTTAGYQINLPRTWYFEKNAGSGVSVYPDYDPAAGTPPECKVEISTLPNPEDASLSDWLAAYFREDPTADIEQVSLTESDIAGSSGIIWSGSENGVSTTLAYVAHENVVYEIAPSPIEANGSSGNIDPATCANAFTSLLSSFQFLPR